MHEEPVRIIHVPVEIQAGQNGIFSSLHRLGLINSMSLELISGLMLWPYRILKT
jgi:hypothetical protein